MNNSRKQYLKINGKNISGKVIEKYRELRGLSRQDLSDRLLINFELDLPAQSIYNIEMLNRTVSDYELFTIFNVLNIDYSIVCTEILNQIINK